MCRKLSAVNWILIPVALYHSRQNGIQRKERGNPCIARNRGHLICIWKGSLGAPSWRENCKETLHVVAATQPCRYSLFLLLKKFAKGKGELQTFWILPTSGESAMFGESMLFDPDDDDEEDDDDPMEKENAAFEEALIGMYSDEKEKKKKLKWIEKNSKSVGWIVELLFWEVKGIAWERRYGAEIDVDDIWIEDGTKDMAVKWDDDLCKALFELHNSTNQRGDKAWRVAGDDVKEQLKLFVLRLAFRYSNDAPFHNFDHACHVLMAADKLLKQLGTTLGKEQQLNSWVRFTLLLGVFIGDISPAELGLDRVSETSSARQKASFDKALETAWNLLMDKRLSELRQSICVNVHELDFFRQLLVNLVFAGDISIDRNHNEREERWSVAFTKTDKGPNIYRQLAAVLEQLSLASQWTHTMQVWETYKKWNACLFQELSDEFEQGVIPVDPGIGWYQQEVLLFDRVIIPLVQKLQTVNALEATGSELLKHATHNRRAWGRLFLVRT